jgi:hypothetical protein
MGSGMTKDEAEAAPVISNVVKTSPANVRVKKNGLAKEHRMQQHRRG